MFAYPIETNLNDYQGSLEAIVFEGPPSFAPTNVIRSDQDWGIRVSWEVHGPLAGWLDAEFRITIFLEKYGTGSDVDLAPAVIPTLSVLYDPATQSRTYSHDVNISAGVIPNGVYKIATCLQLYELGSGNPVPIAAVVEGETVHLFDPAP